MCVSEKARDCFKNGNSAFKSENSVFINITWKVHIFIVKPVLCGILGVLYRTDVFLPQIN